MNIDDLSLGFLIIIIFLVIQVMYLLWKVHNLNHKINVLADSCIDTYRALSKLKSVEKCNLDAISSILEAIKKLDISLASVYNYLGDHIDDNK